MHACCLSTQQLERRSARAVPASAPCHLPPACRPPPADARYSATAFVAASAIFLPWMLTFMIGGPGAVGQSVFDRLDATAYNYLNLGSLGSM